MAKLYFKYGSMNSGKSTMLIQAAYNFECSQKNVVVMKSTIDTKGGDSVVSRIGVSRKIDYWVDPDVSILKLLKEELQKIDVIFVDEANFMCAKQITELFYITRKYNIPVNCYGLRMDFQTHAFSGSARLFELADELEEITSFCVCGKKARFNARKHLLEYTTKGDQVEIDSDKSEYTYESLCGDCYVLKVLDISDEL